MIVDFICGDVALKLSTYPVGAAATISTFAIRKIVGAED